MNATSQAATSDVDAVELLDAFVRYVPPRKPKAFTVDTNGKPVTLADNAAAVAVEKCWIIAVTRRKELWITLPPINAH